MVTISRTASHLTIVASPNRSSSWHANVLVLLALALPSLTIAGGFALLGAWPILPLAGLELLAVGSALYYVNWKLQYRHVITFGKDSVRIDKGYHAPLQSWQFERQGTGLAVTPERHPWEGPALAVHDRSGSVRLGEFLNREDRLKLLALLRRELRVGTYSAAGTRDF